MIRSLAVLSDIHGVLPALDAVLAEPAVATADRIVVAGDHTWGPQPVEVLDRLAGLGPRAVLVRGNADRELLQMSRGGDVGLGDDALSVWGAQQLTEQHRAMLDTMPERCVLDVDGFGPVLVTHATPRNDDEVVLVDSPMARWAEVLADVPEEVQTLVIGHTHMPFVRLVDGRLVVNPGSVGLPYGRAGAHWARLEAGSVTLGRTLFDVDEAIAAISRSSSYPGAAACADEALRSPASDEEALRVFGARVPPASG